MALIADWIQLGSDLFYRRPELYSMGWDRRLNLEDFLFAAAPLGGPIALIRKDEQKKFQSKPLVFIFSASGEQITSFKWTSGHLIHVGWSRNEDLICIQEDGVILLYDIFGTYLRSFNMGQEVKDFFVKEAQIFTSFQDTGIAVLTKHDRVQIVNNINQPSVRKYPNIPTSSDSSILCWCPIREERTTSVIVSVGGDLFLVSNHDQTPETLEVDWSSGREKVVAMAISSNYRHLALYSQRGILWMGSSDLATKDCEYNTNSSGAPKQIAWCGTGAVVLLWSMTLEVVSIGGDSTTIYMDSRSYLVQEIDSVRIISSSSHDILHKVPQAAVETLGIGSLSSGALLFEASQGFQERSTRANDCLREIRGSLEEAISQCLKSARHEFNPLAQKALLRAALFGKTFVPEVDPEQCRKVTTTLRILNAVRDYRVGIPITWNQLEWMTIPVLINRLVLRRLFPLAIKIASFLKLPESEGVSRILALWACYKVKQPSQKGDDQIAREINAKLGYTPGISYTDIAQKAEEVGRTHLARKLIQYECRPSKQVPVLLRLGEDLEALKKSLQSGDTDLVHSVLPHLRKKRPLADFLMLLRNFPVAQALYVQSCRESNVEKLKDIFIQDDDFYNQALLKISEAFDSKRIDAQLAMLHGAFEDFKKGKNELNASLTEDQVKLLKTQIRLEESQQKSFVSKSLFDTILNLIKDGQIKEAEKLKNDFKITDKRYFLLRVMGHAEASHWDELSILSKNKKLPIGFEPFVNACLKYGKKEEAQKYARRVKEENKVTYFIKCGLVEEALKLAEEAKSASALKEVAAACRGNLQHLQNKVQTLLSEYNL